MRARLTQIRWNGTVARPGIRIMSARLARTNSAQRASGQYLRSAEGIANAADCLDLRALKLGTETADVDVDHVGSRIEAVSPDLGEELLARAGLARVAHEIPEQERFPARERDPAALVLDL